MQNDLISRSAVIEWCKKLSAIEWNHKAAPSSWADAYESFVDDLEDAPAVDAVEIVRCKDCIYYEIGKDYLPYCNHADGGIADYPREDDFCSYGEKRSVEHD